MCDTCDPADSAADTRLRARVDARKEAQALLALCREDHEFLASQSSDAAIAFWEEVRDESLKHAPLPPVEPKVIRSRPMSDAEVREFEKETMPLGSLKGKTIGQIMAMSVALEFDDEAVSGHEHLCWLADQTFIDNLRRYLANESILRQ